MYDQLYNRLLSEYAESQDALGVQGERLAKRLSKIAEIGLTADGGSDRVGFSEGEKRAKELVISWMEHAGMSVRSDEAGNVIARLEGSDPSLPPVISGSHVDSVPNGGHFDGPLGVLSSLEVVEAWATEGYTPKRAYEVVIFTDEEGSRFNSGLTGSRAMTGVVDLTQQMALRDATGDSFEEVLAAIQLDAQTFTQAKREFLSGSDYIELHIEQGKVLEEHNLPVGVVSGIAGPRYWKMTFTGVAGHAGNTAMNQRQDALVAASQLVHSIASLPIRHSETAVATVGKLTVEPNGANVIPGKVTLVVDVRDITAPTRDVLFEEIKEVANTIAQEWNVSLECEETINVAPVPVSQETKERLHSVIEAEGFTSIEIPSGAGHDAMLMGTQMSMAMIFVRSVKGISHHPDEWTTLADCVTGVKVLKRYVEQLQ
ncbi:Zn-dependent hydrolase [Geomicrobium sp. JCM 19038]|uniref:Zn-dependent hydrolase n=1 Tax=Geomicrobium sp. JCM 19038 TaxID=1460635 RepID=UPI00045F2258|nr:Zn-dependent hydrolase [Geomicrobium sp. JCM 19038]GAK07649.1 N-carbamoyl-L-amino acid hydrolase [Geomicrobium sp. JCM 19038]